MRLAVEPKPTDLMRLNAAKDNAQIDRFLFLKGRYIIDCIKIANLNHTAHRARNIAPQFRIAVLFQF